VLVFGQGVLFLDEVHCFFGEVHWFAADNAEVAEEPNSHKILM
jgi:hypothetical protein